MITWIWGASFFATVSFHRIAISSTPCYLISLSYFVCQKSKHETDGFCRSWALPVGSLESTFSGSIIWIMSSDFLYLIITNHQPTMIVVTLDQQNLLVVQILSYCQLASILQCQLMSTAGLAQNSHQHL